MVVYCIVLLHIVVSIYTALFDIVMCCDILYNITLIQTELLYCIVQYWYVLYS
jgi:hypothetical protein